MKKEIIKQLMSLSRIRNKEKTWISDLSDDQIYDIYLKLRCGESLQAIAKHAKQVWKINTSSSIHSIAQGIGKYKKRISHLLTSSPKTPNEDDYSSIQDESENEGSLMRMERMAFDLEGRIKRMMSEERKTGVIYPHLNKDIQSLANLRKSIIKQKDWEMNHRDSIQEEKDKLIEKNIRMRFDKVTSFLTDDGRSRLVSALQRFLELAEKSTILMEVNNEGKLVPVDKNNPSR